MIILLQIRGCRFFIAAFVWKWRFFKKVIKHRKSLYSPNYRAYKKTKTARCLLENPVSIQSKGLELYYHIKWKKGDDKPIASLWQLLKDTIHN